MCGCSLITAAQLAGGYTRLGPRSGMSYARANRGARFWRIARVVALEVLPLEAVDTFDVRLAWRQNIVLFKNICDDANKLCVRALERQSRSLTVSYRDTLAVWH